MGAAGLAGLGFSNRAIATRIIATAPRPMNTQNERRLSAMGHSPLDHKAANRNGAFRGTSGNPEGQIALTAPLPEKQVRGISLLK
jgi:hypothetical protein